MISTPRSSAASAAELYPSAAPTALPLAERLGRAASFLIFEPDSEGHPREWLEHLLHFAVAADNLGTLWFVVAPELAPLLADAIPTAKRASIRVLALQPFERSLCCHRALAVVDLAPF